jgi:hypothetical protein
VAGKAGPKSVAFPVFASLPPLSATPPSGRRIIWKCRAHSEREIFEKIPESRVSAEAYQFFYRIRVQYFPDISA